MLVYGLRLLVALITFAVGISASRLAGSGCSSRAHQRAAVGSPVENAYAWRAEVPPPPAPPKRECRLSLSPTVVEGGILNARASRLPMPAYPAEAKAARVSGSVPVRVVVDEGGRVASAQALGGPWMLRQAAADAAREAVFAPTLLSGRPVRVGGTINYNFSLR